MNVAIVVNLYQFNIIIKLAKNKNEISISSLAENNAKQSLKQKLVQSDTNNNLIEELASKFNINNNIELIEVYDNSHIQGTDSVGSLICFSNEGFVKKRYRKFNIKDEKVKNDDYGMMKEVLFRRFSKAIKEKSGSLSLPDLIKICLGFSFFWLCECLLQIYEPHPLVFV